MRVIVALRPTNRRGTKGEYTAFRKRLVSLGFYMVQPEVFVRAVTSRRIANRLLDSLSEMVPTTGVVCALTLTERQFGTIRYLVGEPDVQERIVGGHPEVTL